MSRENLEELRDRLLGEERVQQMVQARAYEIYQVRGGQPGFEARDWFQAESEVLAFLIALESSLTDDEPAETPVSGSSPTPVGETEPPAGSGTKDTKRSEKKKAAKPVASKKADPKPKAKRTSKSSGQEKRNKDK